MIHVLGVRNEMPVDTCSWRVQGRLQRRWMMALFDYDVLCLKQTRFPKDSAPAPTGSNILKHVIYLGEIADRFIRYFYKVDLSVQYQH